MRRFDLMKVIVAKVFARIFIPNSNLAEIVELEAKRKLGKLGGGESIQLEVKTALHFLDLIHTNVPVVIFDIGANVGDYSFELMRLLPNVDLVAFEPSGEAFNQLKIRFQNLPNVTLVNSALGKRNEDVNLYFDHAGSGLASLSRRNLDHLGINFEKSESIPMITAEKWMQEHAIFPTFVKIDVEGYELDVLLGFGMYLKNLKLIQFEFGGCNIDSRTFFKDFWVLLNPLFDIYRITRTGPQLINRYTENEETFMTSNLIALRRG